LWRLLGTEIDEKKDRNPETKDNQNPLNVIPSKIKSFFTKKKDPVIVTLPFIPKLVKAVGKSKTQISNIDKYRRFTLALQELGSVFVKFGQIMSTQQEALPPALIRELKVLKDDVEVVPFKEVKSVIENHIGGSIKNNFSYFNETAIAGASLSQVYEARLKDGTEVVLKVQRPNLREKVRIDLSILKFLAYKSKLFSELNIYNISGIVNAFSKQIIEELDFVRDGKNADILAKNMKEVEGIYIPKIFWEYSGPQVLVMERINGVRIDDLNEIKKMNLDPHKIALNALHAYLTQIFQDGFFHADPHSGNLLIMESGDIAFLDFGLIGVLRPEKRTLLLRLLMGMINTDVNDLIEVFEKLGVSVRANWLDSFKDDLYVSLMATKNEESKNASLETFDVITDVLRKYHLRVPIVTMLMIKVITMVGDFIITIDPDFIIIDEIEPYLGRIVQDNIVDNTVRTIRRLPDSIYEFSKIPESINDAGKKISDGNFTLVLDNKNIDRLGKHIDRAVTKMMIGVGFIFIIVGVILYIYIAEILPYIAEILSGVGS
jgi:ubiquinone biosynthesis protein